MLRKSGLVIGVLAIGFAAGTLVGRESVLQAQSKRVFEIRTYTANEGRLETLLTRMREHEVDLFKKHNMPAVAFFTAAESPKSANTFVYILSHESLEAAKANWAGFQADPNWREVRAKTEANGPTLSKTESVFVSPTDFSPLK